MIAVDYDGLMVGVGTTSLFVVQCTDPSELFAKFCALWTEKVQCSIAAPAELQQAVVITESRQARLDRFIESLKSKARFARSNDVRTRSRSRSSRQCIDESKFFEGYSIIWRCCLLENATHVLPAVVRMMKSECARIQDACDAIRATIHILRQPSARIAEAAGALVWTLAFCICLEARLFITSPQVWLDWPTLANLTAHGSVYRSRT
jgi:hypothetical protein